MKVKELEKVLDIEGVKIPSINNKYQLNPKSKTFFLTKEYREFKDLIALSVRKKRFNPPYRIIIEIHMALDIDNPIKPILDGLEHAGIIENDNKIYELILRKRPIKKGHPGKIKIWMKSMS